MKDHRVSLRYAQALFELGEKAGCLDELHQELADTIELVERHPEISNLLMNTTIAREEKEDFLEKILPEGTLGLLINFVKVLIKKRRFQDLPLMAGKFEHLFEQKKGVQRVRVHSPIALDETLQEKIRRALGKKLNREILLESVVDPGLLGGLVLDLEESQIDGSFRTALQELKQRLAAPA